MRRPTLKRLSLPLYALLLCTTLSSFECSSSNPAPAASTAQDKEVATAPTAEAESTGPKPGKWEATVSNGYKGDKITFRVSADGRRIEDVEFKGNWRSRSGYTETLENLDLPKPVTISKNAFSDTQQVPKAGMWWEFIGNFTSATTAEGSYRCAFAGGENDTYKLKWTAKRVGS